MSTQANVLATMLQPADSQKVGDPSEDLTLRAAMYGVLFLSFIDKVSELKHIWKFSKTI